MSARTASLGMYDMPAIAPANDALWSRIAEHLRVAGVADVPAALDRTRPLAAILDDPGLLLAQTCGYPFVTRWRDRLRYVATPCYAAPGCEGALYRSLFVAHADDPAAGLSDFRGRIAAFNERSSNSGYNVFRAAIAPLARQGRFFTAAIETGSHLASARAVAERLADIAAIDAVTFAHLARHDKELTARLRIVACSAHAPGLPLVTSREASDALVTLLRAALARSAPDPALMIEGFEVLPDGAYDTLLDREATAVSAGYAELA